MTIIKQGKPNRKRFDENKLNELALYLETLPEYVTGILTNGFNLVVVKCEYLPFGDLGHIAMEVAKILNMDPDPLMATPANGFGPFKERGVFVVERT